MLSTVVALALLVSPQDASTEPQDAPEETVQKVEQEAANEKICRYIREDMNSRRKKKVCLTKDQWQELNQGN